MQVKVHWIIDGVAEMEAESFEAAEKHIEDTIRGLIDDKPELLDKLGARAIQGKAYLPGSADDIDDAKSTEE
ncbi:translation initiation factor IF-2 [Alphaproteobacteria bacterium]|nr:translation initiation factor IF-2 [Alphaproteobacteria bacterium]